MEDQMTNNQFKGIIKMIIALIRNDTPKGADTETILPTAPGALYR